MRCFRKSEQKRRKAVRRKGEMLSQSELYCPRSKIAQTCPGAHRSRAGLIVQKKWGCHQPFNHTAFQCCSMMDLFLGLDYRYQFSLRKLALCNTQCLIMYMYLFYLKIQILLLNRCFSGGSWGKRASLPQQVGAIHAPLAAQSQIDAGQFSLCGLFSESEMHNSGTTVQMLYNFTTVMFTDPILDCKVGVGGVSPTFSEGNPT